MSPADQINAFANSVYLTIKNRYFDDITGEDGQVFVNQMIDWTNMFVDELEYTVAPDGTLVEWWFTRNNGFSLGTATQNATSISMPNIERMITDDQRYVQISQDGIVISNWAVVNAKNITNKNDRVVEDMCAQVGSNLIFSRAFRDTEAGGIITGDVVTKLPRLSATNAKLLTIVKPKQLLVLGVAKNATLPDIVQGKLSPSFAQKYDTLLSGAISRSMSSSKPQQADRQSFSGVGGVY